MTGSYLRLNRSRLAVAPAGQTLATDAAVLTPLLNCRVERNPFKKTAASMTRARLLLSSLVR